MKKKKFIILFILIFLISLFLSINPVIAEDKEIVLEFYHSEGCEHCEEKEPIVDEIREYFEDNISVNKLALRFSENKDKFFDYGFISTPGIVVINLTNGNFTLFPYELITFENLKESIEFHLIGNYSDGYIEPENATLYCFFDWFCINAEDLSLPVLTIVIAVLDSFNPCSFFILVFLLNLLIYVRSRKRMLFIGGIFIFFSAFIYFLLMSSLTFVILLTDQQLIITFCAGILAVVFGGMNIKDFFLFKKGASLSISEDKKSKLYKNMGKIVRTSYLPALFVGTVILAIFANTYELLCSLGLPFFYISQLTTYSLDNFQYYLFLVFYNIIYVLPLLVILFIFVIKVGKKKLSEWQGRVLKLISGVMMFSLGIVLLISPDFLKNIFAAIFIVLFSLFLSFVISYIWKIRYPDI
jgi:hypothetical protein